MNQQPTQMEKIIIVDWGTTSLRATLTDASGHIFAEIENERGIQFIKDKAFEPELVAAIDLWLKEHGPLPVIALGMITSKNGWIEVPYVACPATSNDLAKGVIHRKLPNGSNLYFLPGITDKTRAPFPDVVRGEETQILGFGVTNASTVVLPGTHSKWSTVSAGHIQGFQTFVTGEIFALMSQHSFIAKAAGVDSSAENFDAFERGAKVARDCEGPDTSFLTQLFSVRTGMLAGQLAAPDMISYLSGLLIGSEFRQAKDGGLFKFGDTIGIVGNDGLNARYHRVADIFNLTVRDGGEQAAVVGALEIYQEVIANAA
ncbi:MAG: 2-dehydro-3-deoxygalactonokinase [Pseudoruegeria sp.]